MLRGSIISLVTPFTKDLQLDEKSWRELIHWQEAFDFEGFLVGSKIGEGGSLTLEEKVRLASLGKRLLPGRLWIVELSSLDFCERGEEVKSFKKAGVSALLISLEDLLLSEVSLSQFYLAMSKSRLPIIVEATHIKQLDFLRELLAIPQVSYIKDNSSNPQLALHLFEKTGAKVFLGQDRDLMQLSKREGCGFFSVVGGLLPKITCELIQTRVEEDIQKKLIHQKKLMPVHKLFQQTYPTVLIKEGLYQKGICEVYMREKASPLNQEEILSLQHHLKLLA